MLLKNYDINVKNNLNDKMYTNNKEITMNRFLVIVLFLFATTLTSVAKPGGGTPGEWTIDLPDSRLLNPSELMFVDRAQVNVTHTFGFLSSHFFYGNYTTPVRTIGTFAATVYNLYSVGTEARNRLGNPLGVTIGEMKTQMYLSYAHKLRDDFYIGVNGKFLYKTFSKINENNLLEPIVGMGAGLDVGLTYSPITQMAIGLSFINLPFIAFGAEELKDTYPINFKTGIDYLMLNDKLLMGLDADIIDLITGDSQFNNGANSTLNIHYDLEYFVRRWFSLLTSLDADEMSFGLSYLGHDLLNFKEQMTLRYKAGYNYSFGEFTNQLGLVIEWGETRQEIEARRLAGIRQMAPINAFDEAMRLYRKKQYWQASYAFGQVASLYPEFKRIDETHFYIAESFMKMGFEDAAEYGYRRLVNEYPEFKKKDECTYRLQNIYYRRGDYDKVLEFYRKIAQEYPESPIFSDASYLAGQVYYRRGDVVDAIDYYKAVLPQNESYRYAQYALALCFLNIGDSDESIAYFKKVISTPATTELDRVIVERTFRTLGHLYFEVYDYENAIKQYKQVVSTSKFYDDALVGYGWSLVNQQKYKEAITVLNRLIKEVNTSSFVNEAHLVKGYCYTLLREYGKAIKEFTTVTQRCHREIEEKGIDPYEVPRLMSDKELEIVNMRDQLLDIELSVLESVLRKPSKKRDDDAVKYNSVVNDQLETYNGKKDLYRVFQQDVKIVENYEQLLQDAEYASATAEHLEKEMKRRELDDKYEDEIRTKEKELMEKLRKLEGR